MRGLLLVVLAMGCGPKDDSPADTTPDDTDSDDTDTDTDIDTDTDTDSGIACGSLLSATSFGGVQGDGDPIFANADDGTTYIASYFQGEVTFDAGGPAETTLVATGTLDTVLIRYSPTGAVDWVRQIGGTSTSSARGLTALADGVAIAGLYADSTTISVGQNDSVDLNTVGTTDAFVASFNGAGGLSWARGYGSGDLDFTEGVAALDDGSVIVVTTHNDDVTIGAGEPNETFIQLPLGAAGQISIVSFAGGNGNVQWVEKVTGDVTSKVDDVAADGNQLVVIGHVLGPNLAIFGASQPQAMNMQPLSYAGFVARYNTDATIMGLSEISGWGADTISMADDGSALISGAFSGQAIFDVGNPGEVTLSSSATDIFVARYQATGVFLWAVKSETVPGGLTSPFDIQADSGGGAVVVGSLSSRARFGKDEPNQADLEAQGQWDGFAARYDSSGNLQCARQIGGDEMDASYAVIQRPDGTWDVGGFYSLSATVSLGEADAAALSAEGGTDIFRANYSF